MNETTDHATGVPPLALLRGFLAKWIAQGTFSPRRLDRLVRRTAGNLG